MQIQREDFDNHNLMPRKKVQTDRVPANPFRQWLLEEYKPTIEGNLGMGHTFAHWCGLTSNELQSLQKAHHNRTKTIELRIVDRVLSAIGRNDLLNEWYPCDEAGQYAPELMQISSNGSRSSS